MAGTPFGPGSVLAGRFTLDDLLDEQDGARFWRATDRTLARSVAVHVLPADDRRAGALLAAARSSALVSDGRLLRVLDAASADGVVYVVNEWGTGVSLDRMITEAPLSPRRAAWVVKEVADSIATAHRNGVAHGRLLPENVMISESGAVKIVGFVVDAVLRDDPPVRTRRGRGRPTSSTSVRCCTPAWSARWPGTAGSTIPDAPVEHGRPLRPRRVRAGVPRPLDAICERVLNAGAHPAMVPLESAHEVYAALSDYIGDPVAGSPSPMRMAHGLPGGREQVADTPGGPVPTRTPGRSRSTRLRWTPASWRRPEPSPDPSPDPAPDRSGGPSGAGGRQGTGRRPGGHPGRHRHPRSPTARSSPSGPRRAASGPHRRPRSPDPPPRPLFADGPHVTALTSTGRTDGQVGSLARGGHPDDTGTTGAQRSTGAGNGRVPPAWGPDLDDPPPAPGPTWSDRGAEDPPAGRTWLRLGVVLGVLVLLVVGVLVAVNLGPASRRRPRPRSPDGWRGDVRRPGRGADPRRGGQPTSTRRAGRPRRTPTSPDVAVDGDPATAWRTSTYYDPIGDLKDGVGLLVDLGRRRSVGDVAVRLVGDHTAVSLLARTGAGPAPRSTQDLNRVAAVADAGTRVDLRPDPARHHPLARGLADLAADRARWLPGSGRGDLRPDMSLPQEPDDRALLAAHLAGDADAFGRLFARHRDRLWAVALRTTGEPEEAADALQDAMVAAFRRAETYRGDAAVTTWLHRVVVNACLDRLRRRKVRLADPLPDDLDRYGGPTEQALVGAVLGGGRPGGPGRGPRATGRGAGRAGPAAPRPAGGAGARRPGGVLGAGDGGHPGLRPRDGEEPVLPGPRAAAAAPAGPPARSRRAGRRRRQREPRFHRARPTHGPAHRCDARAGGGPTGPGRRRARARR